ncbi:MAG: efflux RND transporter periplasmic adaptor subunit [Muribaculaceae bacterium]|nr:efflux RND transporter periplasmic adaptor subunit [Muribaculaceae bacterium]
MKSVIKYAISAASIVAMIACTPKDEKPAEEKAEKAKVETQKVFIQNVDQISVYTATVEAYKTNNITSSTPNRIKRILVDVGSKVGRGQRVAILDDVTIDQLKIQLANSERDYNRAVELLKIGAGTQQTVDQLKAALDASRRQYRNQVENTVLTSPISGVVTARNYDPGDMPGALPILTIEQLRPVKLIINVSESDFPMIKKGMKVDITLDTYGDEVFEGNVSLIHPTISTATRTFETEITINNRDERVRPGMFARVKINFGTKQHIVVPDKAVQKQTGSGNYYVYVVENGKAVFKFVELGQRLGDTYEILSGLNDGDEVVTVGISRLSNGAEVETIKLPSSGNSHVPAQEAASADTVQTK